MSVFRSISNALTVTFDAVTDAGTVAQESLGIATEFVHNRSVSFKKLDKETVGMETTKALHLLQEELDADEKLAALHAKVMADWN